MKKETIEKANQILKKIELLKKEKNYLTDKKNELYRCQLNYYSGSSGTSFVDTYRGYEYVNKIHSEWLNEELQHITERLIGRYDKSIREAEKELENLRDE